MTNNIKGKIKSSLERFYILWVIMYLFIISGTVAFGSNAYQKYTAHQLPSGYIELKIGKTRYQLGETVEFTVVNHFPATIYVTNDCPKEPLNVYVWENEKWVELHDTAKNEDSECYREPRNIPIPPEGSRNYNFLDWPNLFKKPGVYRIATAIDHYTDIPFQDFVILEPAEVIEVKKEITPTVLPVTQAHQPLEVLPAPLPVVETYEEDDRENVNDRYERRERGDYEDEDDD